MKIIKSPLYLLLIALLLPTLGMAQGIINTVAGNGHKGRTGDGGPATAATLTNSEFITFDNVGNYYIVDSTAIRKVSTGGIISTYAGGDSASITGNEGDGGPATNARFSTVWGINCDRQGNMYFAQIYANRVRKIDTAGIITTFAGNGDGTYYHSGDGGPATAAGMGDLYCVAAGIHGEVYISHGQYVRKVDASGIIATIAGTDTLGYSGDGGPATAARFRGIDYIVTDTFGNLYCCDADNYVLRKIDTNGIVTTVVGNGTLALPAEGVAATATGFPPIKCVAVNEAGTIIYVSTPANRVYRISTGIVTHVAGDGGYGYGGDGGDATRATFKQPLGIALNKAGELLICDPENFRVRKVVFPTLVYDINDSGHFCKVYPNPGRDFYVRFPESATGTATVSLYNMSGAKVFEGTYPSDADAHLSPEIAAGVYTLSVTMGSKVFHGQIIKQD